MAQLDNAECKKKGASCDAPVYVSVYKEPFAA